MKQVTMESVKERIAEASELRHRDGRDVVAERIYEQVVKPMQEQVRLLTEQRDAVVVENVELNEVIEAVRGVAGQSDGISGWHLNGDIARWEEILPEIDDIETTATDAAIAALRAEGVEMFSSDIGRVYQQLRQGSVQEKVLKNVVSRAVSFARQLRESKGANHE